MFACGLGRLRPGISAAGSCSMPGQKNGIRAKKMGAAAPD